ncbi:MAG: hypothetical protein U0271_43890 [Polyangiaceae bacterium]
MQRELHRLLLVAAVFAAGCGPAPDYYYEGVRHPDGQQIGRTHDHRQSAEVTEGVDGANDLFEGRWTGVAKQSDGPTWAIELDVTRTDGGPCAIVRYPDIGCGGYWTCTRGTADNRVRAVEHITQQPTGGGDRCMARVDIELRLTDDDTVSFRAKSGGITAAAKLTRTSDDETDDSDAEESTEETSEAPSTPAEPAEPESAPAESAPAAAKPAKLTPKITIEPVLPDLSGYQ